MYKYNKKFQFSATLVQNAFLYVGSGPTSLWCEGKTGLKIPLCDRNVLIYRDIVTPSAFEGDRTKEELSKIEERKIKEGSGGKLRYGGAYFRAVRSSTKKKRE